MDGILRVEKCPEQLAEPVLHFAGLVEAALSQRLKSPLRFRPRQRSRKGVEGVEEAVDCRQRNLVNEVLRRRNGAPIKGGDSRREHVDEAVQLIVRKRPIDIPISFSRLAVEVVRTEYDFQRATAADELREAFGPTTTGMHSRSDFDLRQNRVLAR